MEEWEPPPPPSLGASPPALLVWGCGWDACHAGAFRSEEALNWHVLAAHCRWTHGRLCCAWRQSVPAQSQADPDQASVCRAAFHSLNQLHRHVRDRHARHADFWRPNLSLSSQPHSQPASSQPASAQPAQHDDPDAAEPPLPSHNTQHANIQLVFAQLAPEFRQALGIQQEEKIMEPTNLEEEAMELLANHWAEGAEKSASQGIPITPNRSRSFLAARWAELGRTNALPFHLQALVNYLRRGRTGDWLLKCAKGQVLRCLWPCGGGRTCGRTEESAVGLFRHLFLAAGGHQLAGAEWGGALHCRWLGCPRGSVPQPSLPTLWAHVTLEHVERHWTLLLRKVPQTAVSLVRPFATLVTAADVPDPAPQPPISAWEARQRRKSLGIFCGNAYILFSRDHHHALRAQHPEKPLQEISKLMSHKWRNVDRETREAFEKKAKELTEKGRKLEAADPVLSLLGQRQSESGLAGSFVASSKGGPPRKVPRKMGRPAGTSAGALTGVSEGLRAEFSAALSRQPGRPASEWSRDSLPPWAERMELSAPEFYEEWRSGADEGCGPGGCEWEAAPDEVLVSEEQRLEEERQATELLASVGPAELERAGALYVNEARARLAALHPDLEALHERRLAVSLWKALSPVGRLPWLRLAQLPPDDYLPVNEASGPRRGSLASSPHDDSSSSSPMTSGDSDEEGGRAASPVPPPESPESPESPGPRVAMSAPLAPPRKQARVKRPVQPQLWGKKGLRVAGVAGEALAGGSGALVSRRVAGDGESGGETFPQQSLFSHRLLSQHPASPPPPGGGWESAVGESWEGGVGGWTWPLGSPLDTRLRTPSSHSSVLNTPHHSPSPHPPSPLIPPPTPAPHPQSQAPASHLSPKVFNI